MLWAGDEILDIRAGRFTIGREAAREGGVSGGGYGASRNGVAERVTGRISSGSGTGYGGGVTATCGSVRGRGRVGYFGGVDGGYESGTVERVGGDRGYGASLLALLGLT